MATRSLITEYVKDTNGNYNSVEIHPITDSASVLTTTTQETNKNYASYTGLPLETGSTSTQETVLQSLLKTRSRLYELRAFNNVTINTSGWSDVTSKNSVPSSYTLYNGLKDVLTNANSRMLRTNPYGTGNITTNGTSSGLYQVCLGGKSNINIGYCEAIVGGNNNNISNGYILEGTLENDIIEKYNGIFAGTSNKIDKSESSVIIGGTSNNMTNVTSSAIIGGTSNNMLLSSYHSIIIGGQNNKTNYLTDSGIFAGDGNIINDTSSGAVSRVTSSAIIAGTSNKIDTSESSVIIGGQNNKTNVNFSSIVGGFDNLVELTGRFGEVTSSNIFGGDNNTIQDSSRDVILGSEGSHITHLCGFSAIMGGKYNNISYVANESSIVGGDSNNISSGALKSVIVGGDNNEIHGRTLGESSTGIIIDENSPCYNGAILGGNHNVIRTSLNSVIAGGSYNLALGDSSFCAGFQNQAQNHQVVIGHYNDAKISTGSVTGWHGTDPGHTLFCIGNGSEDDNGGRSNASNAFRVNGAGATIAKNAYSTSGADYAEFFEWADGNPENEDRRGLFVTLDSDKIKKANENDYIVGIISALPSVIGNYDEEWMGRYILDDFGAFIEETCETEETIVDEETNEEKTIKSRFVKWKQNPDYDPDLEYIPRERRKEWSAVGMLGTLNVIDDGTCEVNGFCKVKDGGIATASSTGYRVIKRVTDNIVRVIFK